MRVRLALRRSKSLETLKRMDSDDEVFQYQDDEDAI